MGPPLLDQEKAEKHFEIQITRELSKQLPEINYCFKNYIKDKNDLLVKIENKKNEPYRVCRRLFYLS